MNARERRRALAVGDGKRESHGALLLLLVGALLGVLALYLNLDTQYLPPLVAALLCALTAITLVVLSKDKKP